MAHNQFKITGFPDLGFKKSLGAFYNWLAQTDGYAGTDGCSIEPVADALTTSGSPVAATLAAYRTNITTGGTDANETISALPSGEYIGQRKLLYLATRTSASDVVQFTVTNIEEGLFAGGTPGGLTALALDAADEYALFEWTGAKWHLVYTNGTITT